MSRYQMKIELLSDLCVSDGGVYNSTVDIDICHDQYGFPYIPAKRIKGCLRECALELNDWGAKIPIEKLFGKKDDKDNKVQRATVRIGDALLVNYAEMIQEAKQYKGNLIFHPQNVLNHFSYIRTQTSIDYKTGVAESTSLRTMRVANKGLEFIADIVLADDNDIDSLRECCDSFTNIGVGRTRGLGEIKVTLENLKDGFDVEYIEKHKDLTPGATRLDYKLYLEEPMICKSINGGETQSLDYIEGSKIQGLIIGELKKRGINIEPILNGNGLFCSNAYLMKEGKRCLEVPADYYSVKNESAIYIQKGEPDLVPDCCEGKQLNPMKHCYIGKNSLGELFQYNVDIEERYHHSRPKDKSIGRATGKGESKFYVISSITEDQTFSGYITGTEEQIRQVYDCFQNLHTVYLGYAHSSEYGKTHIQITKTSKESDKLKVITTQNFMIKLEAPTLIYNDRAFYSTQVDDLDKEIQSVLGFTADHESYGDVSYYDQYVNYTTVGGYNVTWGARKPTMEVFDKGTILHYNLKQPVDLHVPKLILLGERNSEGYGEATFFNIQEYEPEGCKGNVAKSISDKQVCKVDVNPGSLSEQLCCDLFKDFVKTKASDDVKKSDINLEKTEAGPTISNMLLMCQDFEDSSSEGDTFSKLKGDIEDRYGKNSEKKRGKLSMAEDILNKVIKNSKDLLSEFREEYNVSKEYTVDMDIYKEIYLKAYLQQLKYKSRMKNS